MDITHEVCSYDLMEGAFTLLFAYSYFPPRTIHLAVVDPGVGSSRRGIIVDTDRFSFVGPDNGVFSLIYDREQIKRVISIESEQYFRHPVSPTFHARDIFGPVAAWMARGVSLTAFGPELTDYTRLPLPKIEKLAENRVEGVVLHIDKFGNIITNLFPQDVHRMLGQKRPPAKFVLHGRTISRHYRYYSEAAPDELFSLIGSSGYYEIAALKSPAAQLLNVKLGAKVQLEVK